MAHLINNVNEGTTTAEILDNIFITYGCNYVLDRLDNMMYDYLFSTDDNGVKKANTYDLNMKLRALIIAAAREKEARENDIKTIQTTQCQGPE